MTKGLVLVVGLAAIMRLSWLGLIEFKADEALTVLSLQQFWQQPRLIESGLVSSTGVRNFPLFQFLLLLPAAISTDPRWLSGVIGLVNVVMVGWFYKATKREFGGKVAMVAGLLLAMSPYAVLFSRKIWAQDLVMLLAVPIYDLLIRKKPNNFWLGLLLVLQAQLHASGIFFLLVILPYLIITKRIDRKLGLGMGIGMVTAMPYFWGKAFSLPQSSYAIDWNHLWLPLKLLGVFSWKEVMGVEDFERFATGSPAVGIGMLISIVLVIGLGLGMWGNKKIAGLIGGLGFIYLISGVPGRLHYYQVVLPWVAVATGMGLMRLFRKQPLFLKPTVGMMTVGYLLFGGMFAKYLIDNQGVRGDYGIPYQFTVDKVEEVVKPYADRTDIQAIRAWAHFDPVMARDTNGAMRHYGLARYFEMEGETVMAKLELDRAIELDSRFSQISIGENNNEADKAADN